MDDKLILGGHEFQSRFILGSGKFSLDIVKAVVENGGAQMVTLALRRANIGEKKIFSIISQRTLLYYPTLPEQEMPRRH